MQTNYNILPQSASCLDVEIFVGLIWCESDIDVDELIGYDRLLFLSIRRTHYNFEQTTLSSPELSDLNISNQCYQPVVNCVAKLLHASVGLGWSGVQYTFVIRRINERLKSKIYRRVVRLVGLCGSECWPTTRGNERRREIVGTKMLCWTSYVTSHEHVRNEGPDRREIARKVSLIVWTYDSRWWKLTCQDWSEHRRRWETIRRSAETTLTW